MGCVTIQLPISIVQFVQARPAKGLLIPEDNIMRKILAFVLVFAMVLSISVVAFADSLPAAQGDSSEDEGGSPTKSVAPQDGETDPYYRIFNDKDELINRVPVRRVTKIGAGSVSKLEQKDADALLKAQDEAKNNKDEKVRYLYWLDIPEEYKTDDFAYMEYPFVCSGENVKFFVNGNAMEVVHVAGFQYIAKMTEFGVVKITCD